ncbi:MAG: transglycosylase domain-containing protein [Oscillospiraceae bacterium]
MDSNLTNENIPHKKKTSPVKKTLKVIGTTILSLFLVVVITGSIVATALTVYVMKFMDDAPEIDLYNLEMRSSSFIYAYDKDGKEVEIKRLSQDENRIIVSLDQVPKMVQDAFVYTEDERFYDHNGVDFKRTFAAFANMILKFYDSQFGGSTITQQLVKNVTGDNKSSIDRKIREIFTAMNLEKYYPKDDILEAYLNYIGFGGNTYGVQAASYKYYGKDVSQLTLAEAATLAAIPKDPNITPQSNPEKNKDRQEVVLSLMLKNGAISQQEFETAKNEKLNILPKGTTTITTSDGTQTVSTTQSYFVDTVINEVAADLMKLNGYKDLDTARTELANGGYKIYTTVDLDMQGAVEQKFLDSKTFSAKVLPNPPQAAFICLDYNGNIKAVVGGIGVKPGPLCLNRATQSVRSPGSCIKPISTYGYGMSVDMFHWSTIFTDTPIEVKNYETGNMDKWPKNYSNTWSNANFFTFQALQRSLNTIPAQLCQQETPRAVFDFMSKNMGITTLVETSEVDGKVFSDVNLSPLTVGGLTEGIRLKELVSAYQAFGNLGKVYEPTSYTKVTDVDGKVVLEHKYEPVQALDEDSAYVMNKLMQTVIEGPNGTGVAARLKTTPLVGKTGTSQDWVDLSFVGCTPDYVSGVWYGYDEQNKKDPKTGKWVANEARNTYYSSAQVWKNIFGEIAENETGKKFPENPNVQERYFCTITGNLAGAACPRSATPGYYKPSNLPLVCNGDHSGTNGKIISGGAKPVAPVTTPTLPTPQTTNPTQTRPTVTTPPPVVTIPEIEIENGGLDD